MAERVGWAAWRAAALALALLQGALSGLGAARAEDAQAQSAAAITGAELSAWRGRGAELRLTLSAPPAAWSVALRDRPPRLVVDVRGARWSAAAPAPSGLADAVHAGAMTAEDGRVVLALAGPARVVSAELSGGVLRVIAAPASPEAFAAGLSPPPPPSAPAAPPPAADGRRVVVIDPGHGGVDPGAVRGPLTEKALVLTMARDLAAAAEASGRWRPVLTRDADVFVGLRARVAMAEATGAAALLSLHVNTVERGVVAGASVYTFSAEASDRLAARYAETENRADLVAGLDLAGAGDDLAVALVALARRATDAATARLARALVTAWADADLALLPTRPHRRADFMVLRSAQTPSALIELGFMDSAEDVANLRDPAWRARMAAATLSALDAWIAGEAARR